MLTSDTLRPPRETIACDRSDPAPLFARTLAVLNALGKYFWRLEVLGKRVARARLGAESLGRGGGAKGGGEQRVRTHGERQAELARIERRNERLGRVLLRRCDL